MKKGFLSYLIRILVSLAIIFVGYWFWLPPFNIHSESMWNFLIFAIITFTVINAFSDIIMWISAHIKNKDIVSGNKPKFSFKRFSAPVKVSVIAVGAIILLIIGGNLIGVQVFNASRYKNLITVTDGDFSTDVAEIGMESIPVVDRDTAERLGQRKLGEMSDLVSQFEIQEIYTQINYKGRPVRVTPLIYGDFIKWINNMSDGIPAYVTVDMTTQETALVRLEDGIKYSTGEYFMRNLHRYLRFKYPTVIFDNISFEIDDDGTPYWVASAATYRIGLFSGKDICGAVLLNAQTGESKYYDIDEVPQWVDQVYDSDMITSQLIYNGKYRSGFFNSIFGQKGVLQPTEGYNYLAINDDVYLYTGMTSVTSDESNVGFVLVNMRTKETKFYSIPGAEEYSAMDSAEGQVQHLGYSSTFPLLLNISDRPTYFVSLKDGAGLVKMYAFVDVQQYQIVGTGNTVEAARADYMSKLKSEDVTVEDRQETEVSGTVSRVGSAVVDGNTNYYIMLDGDNTVYTVPITISDMLPFVVAGDGVQMTVSDGVSGAVVTKFEVSQKQ